MIAETEVQEKEWDLIIEPKASLFSINVKELWHYRDLIRLWVRREYVGAYKQTILGPLWHYLSPLFTTLVFVFVFGKIAKLPTDGIPMFLFYNAGVIVWNFFNGCFNSASGAFLSNAAIFGKVYFPRLVMPIAGVFSNLIKFVIQLALFLTIYFYFVFNGFHPNVGWELFLVPAALIIVAGISFGTGLIISSLTTKYRDLNQLIGIGLQLLMYGSPIIYSFNGLPPSIKNVISFNPLVYPLESFKYAFFGTGYITLSSALYSIVFMFVVLFLGVAFFNKAERNFMDVV